MMPEILQIAVVLHGAASCPPLKADQLLPQAKKIDFMPVSTRPRLGTDAFRYTRRKLGITVASEIYLEKLASHFGGHFKAVVWHENCEATVAIDADKFGRISDFVYISSNCAAHARSSLRAMVYRAEILPAPKIFLDNNQHLLLQYTFSITKAD